MARIRNLKPGFFKNADLFDAEKASGYPLRLAYEGLWCVADREGRFKWKPREIKTDVLPYDDVDMAKVMDALVKYGFIFKYKANGFEYGFIPTFLEHQFINKNEAQSTIPAPTENSNAHSEIVTHHEYTAVSDTDTDDQTQDTGKDMSACADDADPELAVEAYNLLAKELDWPEAQRISDTRRRQIKARLRECGGIAGWRGAMAKARASPFLRGDSARDKAHENWVPDIDFFLSQKSFTKLMEGKYDQRDTRTPTGFDALRTGAMRAAGLDGRHGQEMAREPDPIKRLASGVSAPSGAGNATNTG